MANHPDIGMFTVEDGVAAQKGRRIENRNESQNDPGVLSTQQPQTGESKGITLAYLANDDGSTVEIYMGRECVQRCSHL